jgi:hypothetical protein
MAIQVGYKKRKKKNTDLNTVSNVNAVNSGKIADVSAIDSGSDMSEFDSLNQKLAVDKNRAEAANAAKKAKEHEEKMKNRNWFQKLMGYDPDGNAFSNIMNGLFFGFRQVDNAVFALGDTIQGDTKAAKDIFTDDWNKGETYGASDYLTHWANTFGLTDAKKFSETGFSKTGIGKAVGIGTDVLLDPANLALMLIPGAGEANIASKIAEGAAEYGLKAAKIGEAAGEVGKAAKAADEIADAAKGAEAVGEAAKGAEAVEEGLDVAKDTKKAAQSVGSSSKADFVVDEEGNVKGTTKEGAAKSTKEWNPDELEESLSHAGGHQFFNANIQAMKKTGKLQEGLKGNAIYESIFKEGAKSGFSKNWEKAARAAFNYHATGVETGAIKDLSSFMEHMNGFDRNFRYPAGKVRAWAKGRKGRTNIDMRRGNVAKEVFEWLTMSPVKALGAVKKLGVRGLDSIIRGGTKGAKVAKALRTMLTPIESGGLRLFNRNKGQSQELVTAANHAEQATTNAKELAEVKRAAKIKANKHEVANYFTHELNGTMTEDMIRKAKSMKVDDNTNVYDVVQDLVKNKQAGKSLKKAMDNIDKIVSNDSKDAFSALKPELEKMWKEGDFRESNVLGKSARMDLEAEVADRKAMRKQQLKENPSWRKNRDKLEDWLDQQGFTKTGEEFLGRYKNMTQTERDGFLKDYLHNRIDEGKFSFDAQHSVAEDLMKDMDGEKWSKMSSTQKEYLRQYYQDIAQTIERFGLDDSNAFGRNWLRDKSKLTWEQLKRMEALTKDNSEWKSVVENNVFSKYTDRDVTQTENFKEAHPELFEAERKDVLHRLKSNVVEKHIDDYITTRMSPGQNNSILTDSLNTLTDLEANGHHFMADRGGLKTYQDKRLANTWKEMTGENLGAKKVYERIEKLRNDVKDLEQSEVFQKAWASKSAEEDVDIIEARNYAIGELRKENPGLAKKFDMQERIDNEIYLMNTVGSENTQKFLSDLDKYVFDPFANKELSRYEEEFESAARTRVENTYIKEQTTLEKQVERFEAKLNGEHHMTPKQQEKWELELEKTKNRLATVNDMLTTEGSFEEDIAALKENGFDNYKTIEDKRKELFDADYRNYKQSNDALGGSGMNRGAPYNAAGRFIKLTEKGKKAVSAFLDKIRGNEEIESMIQDIKKTGEVNPEQLATLQEEFGTDAGIGKFLGEGFTQDTFGHLDAETAKQMGRLTSFSKGSKTLGAMANELSGINASIGVRIGELLGIAPDRLSMTSGWLRQVATDPYAASVVKEAISLESGAATTYKMKGTERLYEKTINTSGVDANKLFADDFLQMDPIKIIADKVGLVEDQLKLQTMFDAMLRGGDMDIVSGARTKEYLERFRQSAAQKSSGKLGREFLQDSSLAHENGKYIVRSSEVLKSLGGLKNIMKKGEYEAFEDMLRTRVHTNMGKDYVGQFANDAEMFNNTFVEVPEQLNIYLQNQMKLFDPEEKISRNFFSKVIGFFNKTWKQFALLNGGYLLRNGMTTWYNHHLAGLPLAESMAARSRAALDNVRWNGIMNHFTGKVVKQGIKHKIENELLTMTRTYGKGRIITREQAIENLIQKGTIRGKDIDLAKEMFELSNKGVIGMFKVHSDYGYSLGHNKALGEAIASKSKFARAMKWTYQRTIGGLTDMNMSLAAAQDDAARLATYRMLRDDPALMQRLGHTSPESGTRYINFDFQNMTKFERTRMRQLIPFYSYMRQSFAFHLKNMIERPTRYFNLLRQMDKQYGIYAQQVDPNGVPQWMRAMSYIPFQSANGGVGVFKPNLPFNDIMNVTNVVGGGLASFSGGIDTLEETNLKQGATSLFGQVNPLFKVIMDTMTGTNSFGNESNHSNFFTALGQEVGGVFTRIPELVRQAVQEGDTTSIQDWLDSIIGLTKHYDTNSIKKQRMYELIEYIESELKKQSGYVMSYQRARTRMYGEGIKSTAALRKPKLLRAKKIKKKKPGQYSDYNF